MKGQWECFSDASYYDKWAVRNKTDRAFHSAIHVSTKEEAEFLTLKLNKLDLYREALDLLSSRAIDMGDRYEIPLDDYEKAFQSVEQALNTEVTNEIPI